MKPWVAFFGAVMLFVLGAFVAYGLWFQPEITLALTTLS